MRRNLVAVAVAIAVIGLAAAIGWTVAYRIHIQNFSQVVRQSSSVIALSLRGRFDGFIAQAELLSKDSKIVRALEMPPDARTVTLLNQALSRTILKSGADLAYVIDDNGNVIASSTWIGITAFPRLNLSFRPFFSEALRSGLGLFHALSAITGRPASSVAVRIDAPSGVQGVLVVQFAPLPGDRSTLGPETSIALADSAGVVFLTNRAAWQFRPLRALLPDDLDRIARTHQFDGVDIARLKPLLVDDGEGGMVPESDTGLIVNTLPIDDLGLTLIYAKSIAGAQFAATAIASLVAFFGVFASAIIMIVFQHRQLVHIKNQQGVLLEQRVEERTRELAAEVEIRRRTEQSLRDAEDDLVQATKLATLGQMSAALAHEVSQPVTALAATLKAAERRLDAEENDRARQLVERAQSLTSRLQHIIRHLRSFARKEKGESAKMKVATSIAAALELAETRAHEIGVTIQTVGLDRPTEIVGNAVRLEQVLVNLLLNALDAVAGREHRQVGIELEADQTAAIVRVWDTGPGLPEGFDQKISAPFFTTKEGHKGLGLGLSISQSMLADFGADMRFLARDGGGTVCEVRLPLTGVKTEATE